MNAPSPVTLSYFGKVRSRGDFVRSAQQGSLTRMLDQWLAQGLELLSADPRWKQLYDQLGACHFAFLGVRSRVALAGHLVPSTDSSGRRFPFVATGSFEVEAALPFMSHAPMALGRLWNRLEAIGRQACTADDVSTVFGDAARLRLDIDAAPAAYAASFADFVDMQTVGSLQALLQRSHPAFDLRRTMLALGVLLKPVPASGVSRLDKGLRLPLPADPLYHALVGALWMNLVAPFLTRGDFELALLAPCAQGGQQASLAIGFAGGSPSTLLALFDPDKSADVFVEILAPDWVDAHVDHDHALKKLGSYLQQEQLSIGRALSTFKECFLGE